MALIRPTDNLLHFLSKKIRLKTIDKIQYTYNENVDLFHIVY